MSKLRERVRSKVNFNRVMEAEPELNEKMSFTLFGETDNPKRKAYMAGKLFNDADRAQREKEYNLLVETNNKFNIDMEIFSPIYSPINDKSTLPTALDIFNGDELPLMSSEVVFADMSDFDPGVMMEIGMVIHKDISLYAYLPDIRIEAAGEYEGIYVPFGSNQFTIGGIEKYFNKVYSSFDEALEAYIEDQTSTGRVN